MAAPPSTTCWSTSTCRPTRSRTRRSTTRSAGSSITVSDGIPKVGDEVRVGESLLLTVETTDGRRVGKVLVQRFVVGDAESGPDDD